MTMRLSGIVSLIGEFLHCIHVSARSTRSTKIAPDASKRVRFIGVLHSRLRTVNLRRVALSRRNCLFTALPTGAAHALPAVNFVTRISADPSISNGGIGPHIIRGCGNASVMLSTRSRAILAARRFPRLLHCINGSIVIASKHALLNTSSGTNITRVMSTVTCLRTRPRVRRNGVHIKFGPSRRVNLNTRGFSIGRFNYS